MSRTYATTLALACIFAALTGLCNGATGGALQVGFYQGKCHSADVEAIVGGVIRARFSRDPTIVAALLRMQFHDCFVNGCDASILLDGNNTEKTAIPNLSVRGYEIIDAAKAAVEAICPGVVSCADIIVMSTRDAVGLGCDASILLDGNNTEKTVVPNLSVRGYEIIDAAKADVEAICPGVVSCADIIVIYTRDAVGLANDQEILIDFTGGHTVGVAHCLLFQDRLYNFQNTGKPDPTMDSTLLNTLKTRCPQNSTVDNPVNLDQNPLSSMTVDNSYYRQIILHRGILQIDQELALDPLTNPAVAAIAKGFDFLTRFGQAMDTAVLHLCNCHMQNVFDTKLGFGSYQSEVVLGRDWNLDVAGWLPA
ncbi:unnamed protein product [Fraxinus pennsylvanica]|uniref:Peroxidase n=1 Tax=Fraxinus pennsylvanica TaxID=56036 RepID=A0AAD1ZZ96_9LAMI|nr:unnamed protein product [Fraxinus pennsylvanica]